MPRFGVTLAFMLSALTLWPSSTAAQQPPTSPQAQASPSPAKKATTPEDRAKAEQARRALATYKLERAHAQTQERALALRSRIATLHQELERAASDEAKAACVNGVVFMAFSLQEDIKRQEKLLALAHERAALHRGRHAHAKAQALIDELKALRARVARGDEPAPKSLERLIVEAEELIRLTHLVMTTPNDKTQATKD